MKEKEKLKSKKVKSAKVNYQQQVNNVILFAQLDEHTWYVFK